jgi:NADPH:quinone reductase-like Zn-dependent oxidoreductase
VSIQVDVIQEMEPDGLDAVFDGVGGDYFKRGFSVPKRGGTLVGTANPLSFSHLVRLVGQIALFSLLPNGRSAKYYGTGMSRFNRRPFVEDWSALFELLQEGNIRPILHKKSPILEARAANELLESGQVVGNVVLAAPELLSA